jgi:hypothetical protein
MLILFFFWFQIKRAHYWFYKSLDYFSKKIVSKFKNLQHLNMDDIMMMQINSNY